MNLPVYQNSSPRLKYIPTMSTPHNRMQRTSNPTPPERSDVNKARMTGSQIPVKSSSNLQSVDVDVNRGTVLGNATFCLIRNSGKTEHHCRH